MNEPERPVIECRGLLKTFHDDSVDVKVLRGVDLTIQPGQQVAIVGASGSGKSTLLHLLGGLDSATGGEVLVDGQSMAKLGDAERGRLRNHALGFIYQFHHLLPEFTAIENVAMPLLVRGARPDEVRHQAVQLLSRVGLGERLHHKPGQLSGGERQRAAVARALITSPRCVLADEPTGNLDRRTAEQVYNLMRELNQTLGTSLLVVTHDTHLTKRMDAVFTLEDGVLV
jgi:lipoprotein-releasing system ATP-binding protein